MQEERMKQFNYLVVDDSEFARKSMIKILAAIGGTLAGEASSGQEAVQQYVKLRPDLVFLDVTMPGIEGVDALEMILKEDKEAKVIMVSSLHYRNLVEETLKKGAKDFIPKPVQHASVAEVVEFVLSN